MIALRPNHPISQNARIGAISLIFASLGTAGLSFSTRNLTPMALLFLGLSIFGLWALSDEMGMRKPLVRAATVAFMLAAGAKSQALLQLDPQVVARLYVTYAFMVLLALLLWSAAFLHRQKKLKIIGAIGALASITPLILLLVGHIIVGVGGAFGVTALFALTDNTAGGGLTAIDNIDRLVALWGIAASLTLWSGLIRSRIG